MFLLVKYQKLWIFWSKIQKKIMFVPGAFTWNHPPIMLRECLPPTMCRMSGVRCHIFFLQTRGAILWRVCYQGPTLTSRSHIKESEIKIFRETLWVEFHLSAYCSIQYTVYIIH